MNRGSLALGLESIPLPQASMRPRFMNRGSPKPEPEPPPPEPASMRPRFMNRGSPRPPRAFRAEYRRFNEAPIHESGK